MRKGTFSLSAVLTLLTLTAVVIISIPASADGTTVVTGQIAVAPTISSVSPASAGPPGSPVSVEINGTNFIQSSVQADSVTVSGTGVTVGSLTVTSTKITTTFTIASNASPGLRDVSVRVAGVTGTGSSLFTINKYITVSAPSAVSLGLMQPGSAATASSTTPGTVATNVSTWQVSAKDQTEYGKMSNGSQYLTGTFLISKTSGGYSSSGTGITYDQNGGSSLPFYVQQNVVSGDAPGNYSITIVFAGSIN